MSRDRLSPNPNTSRKAQAEGSTALSGNDKTTGLSDVNRQCLPNKMEEFRVKLNSLFPKTPLGDLLYSGARLPINSKIEYQRELIELLASILRSEQDVRFSCEATFEENLHRDSLRIHELERRLGCKSRSAKPRGN